MIGTPRAIPAQSSWFPQASPNVPTPGSPAGTPGAAEPSWRLAVGLTACPGVQINKVGQRSLLSGEQRLVRLPSGPSGAGGGGHRLFVESQAEQLPWGGLQGRGVGSCRVGVEG